MLGVNATAPCTHKPRIRIYEPVSPEQERLYVSTRRICHIKIVVNGRGFCKYEHWMSKSCIPKKFAIGYVIPFVDMWKYSPEHVYSPDKRLTIDSLCCIEPCFDINYYHYFMNENKLMIFS